MAKTTYYSHYCYDHSCSSYYCYLVFLYQTKQDIVLQHMMVTIVKKYYVHSSSLVIIIIHQLFGHGLNGHYGSRHCSSLQSDFQKIFLSKTLADEGHAEISVVPGRVLPGKLGFKKMTGKTL